MKDLTTRSLSDVDPLEFPLRSFLRPWTLDMPDQAPQIKVDVSETDAEYAVKAEIPGVRKEDIDVQIDGNRVSISAEVKKDEEEKKDGRVLRSERQYGYASRSFTLASDVDDSKAEASYKDGVLTLKLPKLASKAGKRLSVS